MESNAAEQYRPVDGLALTRMLAGWASKRKLALLVGTAGISAALFGVLFQLTCRYQSDGFLRASRTLAEYNAHRAAIEDRANLRRYLQAAGVVESPNGQYLLQALNARMVQQRVRSVMQYSRDDLKLISNPQPPADVNLLGFNISFAAATAKDAAERVRLMGEYLRDSLLRQDLLEQIRENAGAARARQQQLQLDLIAKRLALDEATSRLAALQAIATKYPSASQFESRQLLASDGGSSRFLAPVMQLVGAESHIADLQIEMATLERAIAVNALRLNFYLAAEPLARQDGSGGELFQALRRLKAESFQAANLEDDRLREVVNEVHLLVGDLATKHVVKTTFASGPTVPSRRSGPSRIVLAVLALIGGAVLAAAAIAGVDAITGGHRGYALPWRHRPRNSL
jgi:LPS O-antigen subunit length determinant protein (WzzB/FepE family)